MIWIISNNRNEFISLTKELLANKITYKIFSSVTDTFNHLNSDVPEGIIIDADDSEMSCLEFCHKIKSISSNKKVILFILSGSQSESFEVSVFEAGADEFIIKPIREKALLKRILTRLNIDQVPLNILYKGKDSALQINKEAFSVYLNQVYVPLSRKEFELLYLIASQPGKVFTREEIFSKIWKRIPAEKERTIDVHILRLRKKLGEEFISTQKGIGYRFCA
jgi:two-component system alkaline phosphatase synthesis response regulator PhoP